MRWFSAHHLLPLVEIGPGRGYLQGRSQGKCGVGRHRHASSALSGVTALYETASFLRPTHLHRVILEPDFEIPQSFPRE